MIKVNQKVQKERVFFGPVAASASTTIKQAVEIGVGLKFGRLIPTK